jgi:hypothetical protein
VTNLEEDLIELIGISLAASSPAVGRAILQAGVPLVVAVALKEEAKPPPDPNPCPGLSGEEAIRILHAPHRRAK